MPTCPSCGRGVAEGFAFCPHCGSALPAPGPPAEVRKTVTVVFCDVTGSTGLGERLDPETLRRVMARYFGLARGRLEHHGGTVEKFIGDAVVAVFGIPAVHEDDALRACRAAVEIREAVADLGKELERDLGTGFRVRVGVNTGEVVAGDPAAGQALVTGDAVNVAARLEQAAAPGEILIGEATHRLVRDAVVAEPVEPLALRGKSGSVAAFRLVEVHPTAPGVARRLDSPLVGRERELGLLRQAFDRAVSERACHLFTVLGPAGVGKSRLVEEFLAGLPGPRVLRGRCLAYGEGITFFPVVEVLKQATGALDFEDPAVVERKVCEVVAGEEHGEVVCARLGHLLGLEEGEAVPDETFWAIRRFLETLARERPLVVVFDDVQWGEATFLDLVEHVADWTRDAPILLVCLARPELLDVRTGWGGGKLNATSILLEPLPEDQCERLVANLLGAEEVAQEIRDRVLASAEGNPLFVEQMVQVLIDDGLLAREDGRWVPTGDLSSVPVPPTIQALLAARLDRLSAEERAVIQRASVAGKVFFRGAVAAMSPEPDRAAVGAHLLALVRKELVRPDRSTLPGEDAFRFRHLLIRDAAYESIPKELRAELHERFAGWLGDVAGERLEEQEEILAYHLEQAYRYREELGPVDERTRGLGRRAARHLAATAHRASARGDVAATANLFSRAVGLLPAGDPERLSLLPEVGHALAEAGRYEEARRLLTEAIEAAGATGDALMGARARVADVLVRVFADPEGTGAEAEEASSEVIPTFEAAGDHLWLSRAHRLRSTGPWMFARYAEMLVGVERAAEHARLAGDRGELRVAFGLLSVALIFGPTPVDEAILRLEEIGREAFGLRSGSSPGSDIPLAMLGRFDEARRANEEWRALFEELGRPQWLTDFARGMVELITGDAREAERFLRRGRDELLRMGEKSVLSTLSALLSRALCLQGRFDEALPFIEESVELAPSEDAASQMYWRTSKAMVQASRGDLGEAERLAREAVAIGRTTDAINDLADALADLAGIVAARGRGGEAADLLREAVELFERKGNVVSAGRARERLAELGGGSAGP
ncbi:MAG TPA: adenylate/guanylate cyclase domain-containing protein [Actinomycetota bacterium]|nr:adenylate/guanylate cyclase domain-containing protein [Actinomycetota bacterium]